MRKELVEKTWTERCLTKQLSLMKERIEDKDVANEELEEKVETLTKSLDSHIEARSLLITTAHQSLNEFVMEKQKITPEQVHMFNGGMFIGTWDSEREKPIGRGVFVSKKKLNEVLIANWDKDGEIEHGVKLQKNKTGYVGSWKDGTYHGNGVYFYHDQSIQ